MTRDVRAAHPLDHAGVAVRLADHGRVALADQLVLVQLLDSGDQLKYPRFQRTRVGLEPVSP
jgi:hypothetical protein